MRRPGAVLLLLFLVSVPTVAAAQYGVDACMRSLNGMFFGRDFRIDVWRYINEFNAEIYALTARVDGTVSKQRVGRGYCVKSTVPVAPGGDYGCAVDKACRQVKNNLGVVTRMVEGPDGPDGALLPEGGCSDILSYAYEALDALGGCMEAVR